MSGLNEELFIRSVILLPDLEVRSLLPNVVEEHEIRQGLVGEDLLNQVEFVGKETDAALEQGNVLDGPIFEDEVIFKRRNEVVQDLVLVVLLDFGSVPQQGLFFLLNGLDQREAVVLGVVVGQTDQNQEFLQLQHNNRLRHDMSSLHLGEDLRAQEMAAFYDQSLLKQV